MTEKKKRLMYWFQPRQESINVIHVVGWSIIENKDGQIYMDT